MTFGSNMRELASSLTESFSEELGLSTIKHVTGTDYNPTTGTDTVVYTDETAYVVFEDLDSKEVLNTSLNTNISKATVAGDSVTLDIKKDDLIVSTTGVTYRVVDVKQDQFSAAYILHIER